MPKTGKLRKNIIWNDTKRNVSYLKHASFHGWQRLWFHNHYPMKFVVFLRHVQSLSNNCKWKITDERNDDERSFIIKTSHQLLRVEKATEISLLKLYQHFLVWYQDFYVFQRYDLSNFSQAIGMLKTWKISYCKDLKFGSLSTRNFSSWTIINS